MNGKRERQEAGTRFTAQVFLARVLDGFTIPIRAAERWVSPADLPGFLKNVEKHVRALNAFFDEYLAKHPGALQRGDDPENEYVVEQELAAARRDLHLITRIGKTGIETPTGKSTSASISEEIKTAFVDRLVATAFAAEAEELRKLRAGELKIDPPPDSKGPQP